MTVRQKPTPVPDDVRGALQRIAEQISVDLAGFENRIVMVTGAEMGAGASTIAQWLVSLLSTNHAGRLLYINASAQVSENATINNLFRTKVSGVHGLNISSGASVAGADLHRVGRLLKRLRKRYAWIIIDAPPPSCFSPRSTFLVQQADGVVFVLEAGKTDRDLARNVLKLIREGGGRIFGALLNKTER